MPLHLIKSDDPPQLTQNQFRELILSIVSWNYFWYPILYQRYNRHDIKLGVYLRDLTLSGGGKISVQLFFTVWCWPWTSSAGVGKGRHEVGESKNIWTPWGTSWNLWLSLHLQTLSLDDLKEILVLSLQGHPTLSCWKRPHESWNCRRSCYPCQQGELADLQNTYELKHKLNFIFRWVSMVTASLLPFKSPVDSSHGSKPNTYGEGNSGKCSSAALSPQVIKLLQYAPQIEIHVQMDRWEKRHGVLGSRWYMCLSQISPLMNAGTMRKAAVN